jgi:hypothetical protein
VSIPLSPTNSFPSLSYTVPDIARLVARFFYADERTVDGKLKGMALDGAAHGEFYAQLAKHEDSVPWQATFVKDKGYVQFK